MLARMALALLALATVAARPAPAGLTATSVKAADVLGWSQAERQDRFYRMETLLPHRTVRAGGPVHPLPRGRPLALSLMQDGRPETLADYMAADQTAGLLILQDGHVRLERYGPTLGPKGHWAGFSLAKSVTGILYGAALADGTIRSLDDRVPAYLPEMKGSAYDGVTLRQLLTMTSGVRWSEDYTDPASDVARMYATPADPGLDPIVSYMRRLPRAYPPGTHWAYKTGETDLAGILLARATGMPLAGDLSRTIWRPYGMERDAVWMVNERGQSPGGCCLSASLRDYGRFGQFVMDGARIGGRPVVPPGWLAEATSLRAETGYPGMGYGYFWWIGADGTYDARGIFGQAIHVDPRRRLVVVLLAAWPSVFDKVHADGRTRLISAIEAAVDAQPETGS